MRGYGGDGVWWGQVGVIVSLSLSLPMWVQIW